MLSIGGLQKSSLIDYPEKISAIIFTQGCNFKCPYCHNPELLKRQSRLDLLAQQHKINEFYTFLSSRIGKLDGVVITGGEPTLHKHLPDFIKQIKDLGFCVKLDTNGTNPQMLQGLIDENLVDYIAMDVKAPIEKYEQITHSKINTNNILKSIEIIKNSGFDYEFRTTVVKSQLSPADFEKIGALIKGAKKYYLQKFIPTKTLDEAFFNEQTYLDEEFKNIIEILKKHIEKIYLR